MIRSGTMLRGMLLLTAVIFALSPALAADMPDSGARVYNKAPRHGRTAHVEEESDLLFTPSEAFPEVHLPTHSYDYQGPYYGGPNINYRFQLPYACGVVGYC